MFGCFRFQSCFFRWFLQSQDHRKAMEVNVQKVVEEQTEHLQRRVDELQGELGRMSLVVDENQKRSEVAEQRTSQLEQVSVDCFLPLYSYSFN